MTTRKSKYKRCKNCKELVIDIENCANCAAKNDPHYSQLRRPGEGARGKLTLDMYDGEFE